MASSPGVIERPTDQTQDRSAEGEGWTVTVYDNDRNGWDEVMIILMLATSCTEEEAYMETWEVDHLGKSMVHRANEKECRRVSEIISTIGIRTEVAQEL